MELVFWASLLTSTTSCARAAPAKPKAASASSAAGAPGVRAVERRETPWRRGRGRETGPRAFPLVRRRKAAKTDRRAAAMRQARAVRVRAKRP